MKTMSLAKKAAAVAVLAGIATTASAISSNTTILGSVIVGTPKSFGGFAPVGDFIDNFLFSLPANGGSGYSVANFAPSGLGGTFNTLFSSLVLVSNADGILGNGDDLALATSSGLNVSSLGINFNATSGGNYYLKVIGSTNGTIGGLYTGAISVTAVPEPESYAMLLAGLGVMGAIAIRRNKRKTD